MSSTSSFQALLPYVFRPESTYTVSNGFRTTVNLSNIDKFYANSAYIGVWYLGDAQNNVYVGSNAGSSGTVTVVSASNTSLGVLSANGLSNSSLADPIVGGGGANVFVGYKTGYQSRNVYNSILVGASNSSNISNISNSIAIGNNGGGSGLSNIYVGYETGKNMTGSSNVFIGNGLSLAGVPPYTGVAAASSNKLLIGNGGNVLISGDFAQGVVTIGNSSTDTAASFNSSNGYSLVALDVAGWIQTSLGLTIGKYPVPPGGTNRCELDVNGNFRVDNGYASLVFSNYTDGATSNSSALDIKPGEGVTDKVKVNVTGQVQSTGYSTFQGIVSVTSNSNVTLSHVLVPGRMMGTLITTESGGYYYSGCTTIVSSSLSPTFNLAATTNVFFTVVANSIVISNTLATSLTNIRYNFTLFPVA